MCLETPQITASTSTLIFCINLLATSTTTLNHQLITPSDTFQKAGVILFFSFSLSLTILIHHFISLFSIIISFHYSQSSFHFSSSIIVLGDQQSFLRLPLMYMTMNICSLFLDSVTLQHKYSYSLVNHKFVDCRWEVAVILSNCMSPCSDSQMEKERLWRYRLGGCFLSIIVACFFSSRFFG